MLLIINGDKENVDAAFVVDVINHYELFGKMIVVELEGTIVSQELWASTPVQEGMKLEIVHFVGGG
jgi:sulfur carrier protein